EVCDTMFSRSENLTEKRKKSFEKNSILISVNETEIRPDLNRNADKPE
ncbi:3253_t:CDS:1, partial [Cetraspora pellucida]